jgi:hypothetical protein
LNKCPDFRFSDNKVLRENLLNKFKENHPNFENFKINSHGKDYWVHYNCEERHIRGQPVIEEEIRSENQAKHVLMRLFELSMHGYELS